MKNCGDSLVFKYNMDYDDDLAEHYKLILGQILTNLNVIYKSSQKFRGSIILSFNIESISSQQFIQLVDEVEHKHPEVCGVGLACDGGEDILLESDEYEVQFEKWVVINSKISPVIVKDSTSATPLSSAVLCRSFTKKGLWCRNKTKDPSKRCWRHREQE